MVFFRSITPISVSNSLLLNVRVKFNKKKSEFAQLILSEIIETFVALHFENLIPPSIST